MTTRGGTEAYTVGYSETAIQFLDRRTLDSHGEFFVPYLQPRMRVLDCGCGPGSISLGIAGRIAPGELVGVDMDASQVELAARDALAHGMTNATFKAGSVYDLPFESNSFDAVFSHALFEHLSDPGRGAKECLRVLKPGGVIGVATPDWSGFIVQPSSPELDAALEAYKRLQKENGGDVNMGGKLAGMLVQAGFIDARMKARYENYAPLTVIGELLAVNLEYDQQHEHARALRQWQLNPTGMFAQAWVSCIARKPL